MAVGLVGSLLIPGALRVDPVDSASFEEAAAVLGDNGALAQVATA